MSLLAAAPRGDAAERTGAAVGERARRHFGMIVADGELRQQHVIAVYDLARKAGFENIHFVPPPVLNSKIR